MLNILKGASCEIRRELLDKRSTSSSTEIVICISSLILNSTIQGDVAQPGRAAVDKAACQWFKSICLHSVMRLFLTFDRDWPNQQSA